MKQKGEMQNVAEKGFRDPSGWDESGPVLAESGWFLASALFLVTSGVIMPGSLLKKQRVLDGNSLVPS